MIKNVIGFLLFLFDLIQIFKEIASLSFQVSCPHQPLTNFKTKLNFEFFLLSLSIFGVAAWFPFDKGQSSVELASNKKYEK